jgi:hypothetical protein
MSEAFVGQWIGHVRGSDIGNVYSVITNGVGGLAIRVTVNIEGEAAALTGSLDLSGSKPIARLRVDPPDPDGSIAEIRFDRYDGSRLEGEWSTSTGHAGIVFLSRADTVPRAAAPESQAGVPAAPEKPVELRGRQKSLPSLTLFRPELEALVALLKELVGGTNDVVIAANVGGTEIRQFSKDFLARETLPPFVTHMSLSLADGRQPLQSTITVNLADNGSSSYSVQSDNPIWVSGSAAELDAFFDRYANPLIVFIQRHGLNLNMILLLIAVAALPEVPLISRFALLAFAIVVIMALVRVHRFFYATASFLDKGMSRGIFTKAFPSMVSALSVAAITGLLAWAYSQATAENMRRLLTWLGVP